MIKSVKLKDDQLQVKLILNARHATYFPRAKGMRTAIIKSKTYIDKLQSQLKIDTSQEWEWDEEFGGYWELVVELSGTHYVLMQAFRDLAGQLMPQLDPFGYTPGGDDDFFDYWPGGLEFLEDFAADLQDIFDRERKGDYDFYKVVRAVKWGFLRREKERGNKMDDEIVSEIVDDLANDLAITREAVWEKAS